MSIKDLEDDYQSYVLNPSYSPHHIGMFMQHTISILKDLIQEQQNIYKELAQLKKEDEITLLNIKIGGTD